ncbi:hypothetical protein ARMGADRAFT_1090113 [Armillaria gallica]|uniref:Uncharacterized protein n=1 Tax=Armillaria gallica TaxID=47427 RepID=A0A2H3CHT7_ARMGA|nr:hypothetical protein ARMGADRAFT_1090113 [Armillaria gallica]
MAEPTDPAELAVVAAQDMYNAAAIAIENLLDDFPSQSWDSTRMDTWLIDTVTHWSTCEDNWLMAGVISKEWYKLEYSLIVRVPDLPMDKVAFACMEFNELVERALDYNLDVVPLPVRRATSKRSKATISPSQPRQEATVTASQVITPTPLPSTSKATTPVPPVTKTQAIEPSMAKRAPPPQNVRSSVPRIDLLAASPKAPVPLTPNSRTSKSQVTQLPADKTTGAQQQITQRKVKPMPITAGSANIAFPPDLTSPLHQKPGKTVNIGPPVQAARLEVSARSLSSQLLRNFSAAARASVIPGPDPTLSPLQEGNTVVPSSVHQPLFFPGTDDEEEEVCEDLVTSGATLFEDDGLSDNFPNMNDDEPEPPQDEPMDLDRDESPSPPPMNIARRLRQEPRISFMFDEATGDFVESHPTIFLPRPTVLPAPSQDPQRSTRPNTSPVSRDAAYLKTLLGSKSDATKKKKNAKGKDRAIETKASRKHARTEEDTAQAKDKPAPKKPKLKEAIVIDEDEHDRRSYQGGVSGRGFGEKVPSSAKVVRNGVKCIGVLVVDNNFGDFVEIDKSYWSKEVAPFVGERYTTPCDHCRRLGTQCRKLLTHTVKCVRCHYSKLPCKVNGVPALNPIEHYRPKGYDAVNAFESALNAIEVNNAAVTTITQQYLAGLSIFAHTNNIRVQASRLHGCLDPVEDEDKEDGEEEDDDGEAPEDVAEGIAGPSKQKKNKSR